MSRQNPFALRSFRLPYPDVGSWHAAAAKAKISLSQFLRQALRTAAHNVLERHGDQPEQTKAEPEQHEEVLSTVKPMKRSRKEAPSTP